MFNEAQKILAFSGRKQSGKNTACNFIIGMELLKIGMVQGAFLVNEKGELWISDIIGDKNYEGILDFNNPHPEAIEFRERHIYPYIKLYSFADLLKKEVCIKILGLSYEQCFGTDEDKNSLTHLKWENMPGVVTTQPQFDYSDKIEEAIKLEEYYTFNGLIFHDPGYMTAREVLQYVGTEIFRKMYDNVWVDATLRQIQSEGSLFAIISDVRFPNEVDGILNIGGRVIRLTRNPAGAADTHKSEIALEKDKFDWNKFSAIIDNKLMSINEQNLATHKLLCSWNWAHEFK